MHSQIYLLQNAKQKRIDRLLLDATEKIPTREYQVDDLLMQNFRKLGLDPHERQLLSFESRKRVKMFIDVEKNWLSHMAQELVMKINRLRRKVIHLKADNLGGFICLYALKYFNIDESKEIIMHLTDCPIKLFDQFIARLTTNHTSKVVCDIQENSWLYPYKTLYAA